jgi:hypothetical protein
MAKKIARSVYLSEKIDKALHAHMKAQSLRSISVAIEDALEYALFPEFRDDRNKELTKMVAGINKSLNEHRKATARDMTILQETMFQFMLEYYRHTTAYPEDEAKIREADARARLNDFMERVVRNIPEQRPMKNDV